MLLEPSMVTVRRACVSPAWRWQAMREELAGSPRLVAMAVLGVLLLVAGIAVESAAVSGLAIVGAALLIASLVLPIVSKLTVGSVSLERTEATRQDAIVALADELGPTLREVARWLSAADDERVGTWVHQALAVAYRDCLLVPRDWRDAHALCLLIRAVRGGMGMQDVGGAGIAGDDGGIPSAALRPEHLLTVPFDDRAALVLRRVALLDDTDGAQVIHCTAPEFAARAERAWTQLCARGAGQL